MNATDNTTHPADESLHWTCHSATAQEAVLAGHARVTLDRVRTQAHADAAVFSADFPGQEIEGDWDSQAWEIVDRGALLAGDPDSDGDIDLLWPVYTECLRAAVAATHVARVEKLRAALATRDVDEEEIKEIFPRGNLTRAEYRGVVEKAAKEARADCCVLCAQAGIHTVTTRIRNVRQGFLSTLWRGAEDTCGACGMRTVSLAICSWCASASDNDRDAGACAECGAAE